MGNLEKILAMDAKDTRSSTLAFLERGHISPEGCEFVYNPEQRRYERITLMIKGFSEETEKVRTEYGTVYEVNGKTTFARLLGKPIKLFRPKV